MSDHPKQGYRAGMDEQGSVSEQEFQELIDRHLRGELEQPEQEQLSQLLDADKRARRDFVDQVLWDTQLAESIRGPSDSEDELSRSLNSVTSGGSWPTGVVLALVASLLMFFAAGVLYLRSTGPTKIATITALNGALRWTGDGGQVHQNLSVGDPLSGGTIEGLSHDSWFELQFDDATTITLSGTSMLTLSDAGQKVLHLKEGSLASDVRPQPKDKPMLVHTRNATLEILGTQFEVEAELASTLLNVNEGEVRIRRLTDGSIVNVPAKHRVLAAADGELSAVAVPNSVVHWSSDIPAGSEGVHGKWMAAKHEEAAKVKALPFVITIKNDYAMTLYTIAFGVSRGDTPAVVAKPDSSIRVRGSLREQSRVWVGMTVRFPNGEFAGNFQVIREANEFESQRTFDLLLPIEDFKLESSLAEMKDDFPRTPAELVIEAIWCHTLDQPAGLEISEVNLASGTPPGQRLRDGR